MLCNSNTNIRLLSSVAVAWQNKTNREKYFVFLEPSSMYVCLLAGCCCDLCNKPPEREREKKQNKMKWCGNRIWHFYTYYVSHSWERKKKKRFFSITDSNSCDFCSFFLCLVVCTVFAWLAVYWNLRIYSWEFHSFHSARSLEYLPSLRFLSSFLFIVTFSKILYLFLFICAGCLCVRFVSFVWKCPNHAFATTAQNVFE